MGVVQSAFASVSSEQFEKSLRAQKLHLAFRMWSDVEVWSAFRRVRKLYPNATTLTLSETAEVLSGLEDCHLLFLWEFASEDDQTVDLRFLLTTVCVFSGCPLNEKGRFLLCVFDRSYRGVITCSEVTAIAYNVIRVLEKCFRLPAGVSSKDAVPSVRRSLPEFLPSLAEIISDDETFLKEQVVGASDVSVLINALREAYSAMPFTSMKFALRHKRSQLLSHDTQPHASATAASLVSAITASPTDTKPATPSDEGGQSRFLFTTARPENSDNPAASEGLFGRDTEIAQLRAELNRANALLRVLQAEHAQNCCLVRKNCENYVPAPAQAETANQTAVAAVAAAAVNTVSESVIVGGRPGTV